MANPFEDYAGHLRRLKNESGNLYKDENTAKVLLTLYPSGEGSEWGFVNLTHADLASAVLITPFHSMALMAPTTTEVQVDRHTAVFAEAPYELL